MTADVAKRPVSTPLFSERILACLKPLGGSDFDMVEEDGGLRCSQTGEFFPSRDGVPSLFKPTSEQDGKVTERVKEFYEENPFPSYEGLEDFGELVQKGGANACSSQL